MLELIHLHQKYTKIAKMFSCFPINKTLDWSKYNLGSFPDFRPGVLRRERHGPPGGGASAGGERLASGWRRTAAGAALHSRARSCHHAGHQHPEVSERRLSAGIRLQIWEICVGTTVTVGAKMLIKSLLSASSCAQIQLTCFIVVQPWQQVDRRRDKIQPFPSATSSAALIFSDWGYKPWPSCLCVCELVLFREFVRKHSTPPFILPSS